MLTAICTGCNQKITYKEGDNSLWFNNNNQYCWLDPEHGSELHKPDPTTITEDKSS